MLNSYDCKVIDRAISLKNKYYCRYNEYPRFLLLGQTEMKQLMAFCGATSAEDMKKLHIANMYIRISLEVKHMSVVGKGYMEEQYVKKEDILPGSSMKELADGCYKMAQCGISIDGKDLGKADVEMTLEERKEDIKDKLIHTFMYIIRIIRYIKQFFKWLFRREIK